MRGMGCGLCGVWAVRRSVLSGQVGIINLAASHVIMLTANCARGWAVGRERERDRGIGIGIGIGSPSGPIRCKTAGIKITMIGVGAGAGAGDEQGDNNCF